MWKSKSRVWEWFHMGKEHKGASRGDMEIGWVNCHGGLREARCFGQIACRGVVVAQGKREVVELLTKQVAVRVMKACMVGEGASWRARRKERNAVKCVLGMKAPCNLHAYVMHAKWRRKQPMGCWKQALDVCLTASRPHHAACLWSRPCADFASKWTHLVSSKQ